MMYQSNVTGKSDVVVPKIFVLVSPTYVQTSSGSENKGHKVTNKGCKVIFTCLMLFLSFSNHFISTNTKDACYKQT
jgi:hypothetical protein